MKQFTTAIWVLIVLLQSCTCSKKLTTMPLNIIPDYPYDGVDKKSLDTTFDYQVLERPIIDTILPNNIFGKKVKGTVELFSMIDACKHVADIKIISCKLYRKEQLVYEYDEKMNKEVDSNLKSFLLSFMQDKPFKQNKAVTLQQHPTYCFVRFYK